MGGIIPKKKRSISAKAPALDALRCSCEDEIRRCQATRRADPRGTCQAVIGAPAQRVERFLRRLVSKPVPNTPEIVSKEPVDTINVRRPLPESGQSAALRLPCFPTPHHSAGGFHAPVEHLTPRVEHLACVALRVEPLASPVWHLVRQFAFFSLHFAMASAPPAPYLSCLLLRSFLPSRASHLPPVHLGHLRARYVSESRGGYNCPHCPHPMFLPHK